jgi:hypothetical protein
MSGSWVWAGARAVGTSHRITGLPCQDAFDCAVWTCANEPPVLIAALADGAGSAERAELGARLATSFVVDFIHHAFENGADLANAAGTIRSAVLEARLALDLTARNDGHAIDQFASTLLVAVLSGTRGAIGQIGDGGIVVDDGARGWRTVHWPDHGEYANTTHFLTEGDALDKFRIAVPEQPPRRIAMFSDGLERLVLDFQSHTAHAPFFDRVLARLSSHTGHGHAAIVSNEIAELLNSDKVNDRTDDDKSLLCASWTEA